jgi:hypothetical protein
MVWTRLVTTLNVCGALLAVPAGAAGLYTTYQATFSSEVACRALRGAILSALEKDVDATVKQALVHKDVAEFEHSCALGDPDAKALMTAISNNDRAAKGDDKPESRPITILRPPMPFFFRHWLNKQDIVPSPRDPKEPIGT